MSLIQTWAFIPAAALIGAIPGRERRGWLLVIGGVLAVFWLQPALPIRSMDFWLPLATIALTLLTWIVTRPQQGQALRLAWPTLGLIAGLVVALSLTRFVDALCCLTATPPPNPAMVGAALAIIAALAGVLVLGRSRAGLLAAGLIGLLFGILAVLKTEPLAGWASQLLRGLTGQAVDQASSLDIRWLGFSYIAFRLIHTLRDRQLGTLPDLALPEFVSYAIFFPTLTAGPIDRAERAIKDLRAARSLDASASLDAAGRIAVGLFKKFVLADSLALIALNANNAQQTSATGWLWLMVYAYAFRIYFDFAGYSDIAIGLGKLAGFAVPENFDRPYLKPNLTAFWNSWHMTLAQWFRAYYFNPISRALRASRLNLPVDVIIAFGQVSTMILIGLWHGVSLNFAIWGLWHGLGLFAHNRWAALTRPQAKALDAHPWLKRSLDAVSTLLVFHFVALGWVWFALPRVDLSWHVLARLLGLPA